MLKKAPLVLNGIEKLHDEVEFFMVAIQGAKIWSDKFFRIGFLAGVVNKCPKLKALFKQFFNEFKKLPQGRKVDLLSEFREHNKIQERCGDEFNVTKFWKDTTYQAFAKSAKSLFEFMYDETLNTACYRNFSGEDLHGHYAAYRISYGSPMCPFCGLEDYVDLHPDLHIRDAYDHYLHKAEYPFAAINFHNLFPMCKQCNSDAKRQKDILFKEGTVIRRRAPYPANDVFDLDVEIKDALGPGLHASIKLTTVTDALSLDKFNTWLSIFCIKERYEGRIKQKKQDWLAGILAAVMDGPLEEVLKIKLEAAKTEALNSMEITLQREIILKAPFFAYCENNIEPLTKFFLETPQFRNYINGRAGALLVAN